MTTSAIVIGAAAVAASCESGSSDADFFKFKIGEKVNGFVVKSVTDLPEVDGRLVHMEYEKNGADLAWLDRDDDNKTFVIGFRTLPDDDTGVPHIIEHSVLCGSAKYPVKDPFVELEKSSFSTYLNAWTSSDSTMYPVCSRNQQDFLNLIDVYMDAVLHPLSVSSPLAFRQEGWHYELDGPDGELTRNGVVLSEMKGVHANPESLLWREMTRMLFPDTAYGYESGGDPYAIPSLTFEKYKAFYNRFYHPSNARIFLDGKMDVKAVLAKLDGFLSPYGQKAIDAPVEFQRTISSERTIDYAAEAGKKDEGKAFVATGWICGRFDEQEKNLAIDVLVTALADDNAAPLKKALVDTGLCEDVIFANWTRAQTVAGFVAKGVKAENVEAVRNTVRDTLSRLADNGLDHARIAAIIDRFEFLVREMDSGKMPRGLGFYQTAISLWNYGGDPADAFHNGAILSSLRKKIPSGWFESLLKECFVENRHVAKLTMLPSATLAAERNADEKRELAAIKAGWSRDELEKVLAECDALKKFQTDPNRPEDIAKLPRLSIADIPEKGPFINRKIVKSDGITVIRPHTHANGLLYATCHFSAEDFSADELADLNVLACVLAKLRTARHSIDELRNIREGKLGRFNVDVDVYSSPDTGAARPYLIVVASAIESHADDALDFLAEVLRETMFDDVKTIGNIMRQNRLEKEKNINGLGGCRFAILRATAQLTSGGAADEILSGITQIRHLKERENALDKHGADYARRLAAIAARLFTRERLVVCLPDNMPISWATRLANALPHGEIGAAQRIKPFPRRKEGFRTLGTISGTAMAAHPPINPYNGRAVVAARILSLGHLWSEIRVKGGAYGGNFRIGYSGDVNWASWNDPKPARSLDVYAGCGKALRTFADGPEPIDSYIVSAVAQTEPYLTPANETMRAAVLWLSGRTPADQQRTRSEMLRTTKADLRALADKIDDMASSAAICVVGGDQPLESCTNLLDHIESLKDAQD